MGRVNKIGRQSGFTLLEVMVALIFVSLGIATVIQVTSQHVKNVTELEKRLLASWVASNRIAEIRFKAETDKVRTGGKSERSEMGGHKWSSKATVKRTDVEKVFLVTVDVYDEAKRSKSPYASYTTAVTEKF